MRRWREVALERRISPPRQRLALALWGWLARRARIYRAVAAATAGVLSHLAGRRGRFRRMPFAAAWTATRDLPAPEGGTFVGLWHKRKDRS